MKPRKIIFIISLFGAVANAAENSCKYALTGGKQDIITIDIGQTMSIPRDTPNGTVLYESTPYQHGTTNKYNCSSAHSWGVKNNLGTDTTTSDTFPIGGTGISWQYILNGKARFGYGGFIESAGTWHFENYTTALRLIKTGDIKSGVTIAAGDVGYIKADTLFLTTIRTSQPITITAASCETPDVKVDMGEHDLDVFSKSGSYSRSINFDIKLNNCPSGIKKVTYSLTPNTTAPAWNASMGIIKLHANSTAKGIALQIIDSNEQPVELNKTYTFSNFSSTGGNFNIPLAARYFRTLPTGNFGEHDTGMSAGTANSDISFVMSYL
ncbi:Pilin (type 1 fimbria component protein) [Pseudomonas sp. NFIX28]|nr:Pilin (type 1 fimbria component protein) [Pseudomonas sp. NFIX28]